MTPSEPEHTARHAKKPDRKATKRKLWLSLGAGLLTLGLVGGATWGVHYAKADASPEYPASTVELTVKDTPATMTVGVVVSYTEDPTQGRGWDLNAEGATVANWRLTQGGSHVRVVTVSDQGSDEGAREAISSLAKSHVAGVIAATSGTHTAALADAAHAAGLPIVFPYAQAPTSPKSGTWYGQPSEYQWFHSLSGQMTKRGCHTVVSLGRHHHVAALTTKSMDLAQGTPADAAVRAATKSVSGACLLIDSNADDMGALVAQIRLAGIDIPIFVGPEAAQSRFVNALEAKHVTPTAIYSLGFASPAVEAAETSNSSGQAAAFMAAVSTMTTDANVPSLQEGTNFAQRASGVDAPANDAFLGIVHAAAKEHSDDPHDIADALKGVSVDAADGALAGGGADFATTQYLTPRAVETVDLDGHITWASAPIK